MKTHADAIKALGFEFNNKTGSWTAPHAEGIMVRFKGLTGTRITSRVGTADLTGEVSPEAVNQLVAAMMRNLKAKNEDATR